MSSHNHHGHMCHRNCSIAAGRPTLIECGGACSSAEQHFRCTTAWCRKEATTMDAFALIKEDGLFHCDVCNAVMEGVDQPGGAGGEHAESRAASQKMQVWRMLSPFVCARQGCGLGSKGRGREQGQLVHAFTCVCACMCACYVQGYPLRRQRPQRSLLATGVRPP